MYQKYESRQTLRHIKTSWRNDKRARAANLHLRCNASAAQTQRPCKALHYKCTYSLSFSIHFVTLLSMQQQQLSFYSHWRFNARCADDLVCAWVFFSSMPLTLTGALFFTALKCINGGKKVGRICDDLQSAVGREWHNFSRILTLKHTSLFSKDMQYTKYLDLNFSILHSVWKSFKKVSFSNIKQ